MVRTWRAAHATLLLVALANFVQLGVRLLISPLVPRMLDTFAVTTAAMGAALTGMWAAYALFQFPGGVLGERYGHRLVVVAALIGAAAGSVLVAVGTHFAMFGLFVILLGAGTGLFFPAAASLLTGRFENTGMALSALTAGGAVAGIVAPVAAAWVAAQVGWRPAMLLGLLALPIAAAVARYVPTTPGDHGVRMRDRFDPGTLVAVLRQPTIVSSVGIASVGVFTFQSITSFLPTFLVEYRGVGDGTAALAFGVIFLLAAIAQPLAGRLSDSVGRDVALAASMGVAAVGLAVLVVGDGALVFVAVAILGSGLSWPGVIQARFMDGLSAAERDVGYGLVRTIYMLVGASGSVITGVAADVSGWPVAFGIVVALLGTAAVGLAVNRLLGLGL